jgi:hypothetical protein
MAKAGYSVATAAAVALAAATAKTVLSVIAPAQFGVDLKKVRVAFDGVTASAVPVLVEIMRSTQAGAGTSGTAVTVQQVYGPTITAGFTAGSNFSAEPTALTLIDTVPLLDPNKGIYSYDYPLGDTPDCAVSQAIVIRCTAPAIVNCRAIMHFERT